MADPIAEIAQRIRRFVGSDPAGLAGTDLECFLETLKLDVSVRVRRASPRRANPAT